MCNAILKNDIREAYFGIKKWVARPDLEMLGLLSNLERQKLIRCKVGGRTLGEGKKIYIPWLGSTQLSCHSSALITTGEVLYLAYY